MVEVEVISRSFGKLNGTRILVTEGLRSELENATTRDGTSLFSLLASGRALRGMKHLIERIKEADPDGVVVLSDGETTMQAHRYHINFDDYRKKGAARFFNLYRSTGLDVAIAFLEGNFPERFPKQTRRLEAAELQVIERNLPQVVERVARRIDGKVALLEETSRAVTDLRRKKRLLSQELRSLNAIRRESAAAFYSDCLNELRERLGKRLPEVKGDNSWQSWIYRHNWLVGANYGQPVEKARIGFDSIPDYLFPTLDGFLDILEIKLPTHSVVRKDKSHAGAYCWTPQAAAAIGQVVNYLQEMELHQFEIAKRINEEYSLATGSSVEVIRPRAFILIGRLEGMTAPTRRALRQLNYSLHGIEILTYDDLLMRGEHLLSLMTSGHE